MTGEWQSLHGLILKNKGVIKTSYSIKGTNIDLTRGDSLKVTINITQDGEEYTPQDGDVIRFAMKRYYSDSDALINKTIDNSTLLLELDPEDTKELAFGSYVYDIEMTFANGDVDTFIKGKFTITEEVI